MLSLSPYLKDEKFEQEIQASHLPEGKYIKPASTTKWDSLVLKTKCRS